MTAHKQSKKENGDQKAAPKSTFDVGSYSSARWIDETDFLKQTGLDKKRVDEANISWQELAAIYLDHEKNLGSLQSHAHAVSQMLQQNTFVNSVRTRVKDSVRLIDKIVRKRADDKKDINLENYKVAISDLVGVRVLHILKSEWVPIHTSIIETFKLHKNISPTAYITHNDELVWKPMYVKEGCLCETNDRDYKSVHYDIEIGFTKQPTRLEIQVRTINEEAWGELDHKINYPSPAPKVVGDFIRAANMLSSTADHLSQHIILMNVQLSEMIEEQKKLKSERDSAIEETRETLTKLAKTKEEKEEVKKALDELDKKLRTVSATPADIFGLHNRVNRITLNPTGLTYGYKPLPLTAEPSQNWGTVNTVSLGSIYASSNACKHCKSPLGVVSLGSVCDLCRMKGLS